MPNIVTEIIFRKYLTKQLKPHKVGGQYGGDFSNTRTQKCPLNTPCGGWVPDISTVKPPHVPPSSWTTVRTMAQQKNIKQLFDIKLSDIAIYSVEVNDIRR